MQWYSVTPIALILFVLGLVIGWLKGRHDFKEEPHDHMPSPCGPWEDDL